MAGCGQPSSLPAVLQCCSGVASQSAGPAGSHTGTSQSLPPSAPGLSVPPGLSDVPDEHPETAEVAVPSRPSVRAPCFLRQRLRNGLGPSMSPSPLGTPGLGTQDQDPPPSTQDLVGAGWGDGLNTQGADARGRGAGSAAKASSQLSSHWQGHQAPLGVSPTLCPRQVGWLGAVLKDRGVSLPHEAESGCPQR